MQLGIRGPIPGTTLREKAEVLKRTGYAGIELGGEWLNQSAEDILAQLEGTGIVVSAITGSIQLLHPDPATRQAALDVDRKRFQMAKALGANAVIEVPVFGSPRFDDLPDGVSPHAYGTHVLVGQLRELVPALEETGVRLLLEPLNRYETRFMNRLEQAVDVIETVGSSHIQILADFFHMQIEERVIADALRLAGKHVGYIHLADSNRLLPGAGHTDFRSGFDALKAIRYDGWLTIESGLKSNDDPEGQLIEARNLIAALWNSAAA
jgi:sugar phosphate isomerase/epimerase